MVFLFTQVIENFMFLMTIRLKPQDAVLTKKATGTSVLRVFAGTQILIILQDMKSWLYGKTILLKNIQNMIIMMLSISTSTVKYLLTITVLWVFQLRFLINITQSSLKF